VFSLSAAAKAVAEAHARGGEVVTVTVLTGPGAGQRYISFKAGSLDGALDPQVDARALALADAVWERREPAFDDLLFADLHALAEPLVIFGAGHIAVALANIARDLGFAVAVLDDREDFAQPARFAAGVQVQQLDLTAPLQNIEINALTFVVMLTRAHKYDFDCLSAVLQQPVLPRYIGMIGSKRRVRAAFKALLAGGVGRELLAHVHAPVGLEIGAETPAEIAVSIAAELIQVRRHHANATSMSGDARVLDRLVPENAAQ
jgi:xanthine dehydrogenase accessory factor